MIIHTIDTVAYATRLSGARVGFLASAFSLFNILVIFSRMSNMIQQPLTGSLIDIAGRINKLEAVTIVEQQYRYIIASGTVGTLIGIFLFPSFIAIFTRALFHLSAEKGSIIKLAFKFMNLRNLVRIWKHLTFPRLSFFKGIKLKYISPTLFISNMFITAIYTVGVLASLYAALLIPENASTAIMASGLINGVATIMIFLFVDPKIAILADAVSNNSGSYIKLKTVTLTMVTSRFFGTLLAQFLFIPAAYYVAWFTRFLI